MLHRWKSLSSARKILILVFIFSLPFIYPHVQADGRGYYAYARSILIDHNLRFAGDWPDQDTLSSGLFLVQGRENGRLVVSVTTKTGHLPNHFSVGPAILWSPFLSAAHLSVVLLDDLGFRIEADGFSPPYLAAMAIATAFYGFLGLWFSFEIACRYFEEKWALLATIGIWFASSLTVYMYADPSWSHAHSAFCVALFLWYWLRTRESRTEKHWIVLGLISGLTIDVYFVNAVFLLIPFLDSFSAWRLRTADRGAVRRVFQLQVLGAASALVAMVPTFVARKIVFGSFFALGAYAEHSWNWTSPAFRAVLFSPNRGLLVCTPILIPAIVGLFLLWRREREVGSLFIAVAVVFYCVIAFYPWWDGVLSFGNRFFISLTPLFVVGLAAAFSAFARLWGDSRAAAWRIEAVLAVLIIWNLGLVFQYSTHLFPNGGKVSWGEVVYYEFRVVPQEAFRSAYARFTLTQRPESLYY